MSCLKNGYGLDLSVIGLDFYWARVYMGLWCKPERKERELQRENNIEKDTGREGKRGHAQVRMVELGTRGDGKKMEG